METNPMAGLNPLDILKMQQEKQKEQPFGLGSPFNTPGEVGPETVGPVELGPKPIGTEPPVEIPAGKQPIGQMEKPTETSVTAAHQGVADDTVEKGSESFLDWMQKNKTLSKSEWMKERWEKSGKLGKIAMILDAAAKGTSNFSQAYMPHVGKKPGKPYESHYDTSYGEYSKNLTEERKTRAGVASLQNREMDTLRKASYDIGKLRQGDSKALLDYYRTVSSMANTDFQSRLDAGKFVAAQKEANRKVQMFNEEERRRWAEYYEGMTPSNLQEALTRSLFAQYGQDPAKLAAEVEARMLMLEREKAKARASGRAPRSTSNDYVTKHESSWGIDNNGELVQVRGPRFWPKPGTGGTFHAMDEQGKDFDPSSFRKLGIDDDTAEKLAGFTHAAAQSDIGLTALAHAARNKQDMFGAGGLDLIKKFRKVADYYNIDIEGLNFQSNEAMVKLSEMNMAMMHSRAQQGARPPLALVTELKEEIAGGKAVSPSTALKSMAMFRLLTEYSANHMVTGQEISAEQWDNIQRRVKDWVADVIHGDAPLTNLGHIDELIGGDYKSPLQWGSKSYDPDKDYTSPKQQDLIGAQ